MATTVDSRNTGTAATKGTTTNKDINVAPTGRESTNKDSCRDVKTNREEESDVHPAGTKLADKTVPYEGTHGRKGKCMVRFDDNDYDYEDGERPEDDQEPLRTQGRTDRGHEAVLSVQHLSRVQDARGQFVHGKGAEGEDQ